MVGRPNYRGFALHEGVLLFYTFPMPYFGHGLMHVHLTKSLALDGAHDLVHLKDELLHAGGLLIFRLTKMRWDR